MHDEVLVQVLSISKELKNMKETLLKNSRTPYAHHTFIAIDNLNEKVYYLYQNHELLTGDNDKRVMSLVKKSIRVIEHIILCRQLNQIHLLRLTEFRDRLESFITFVKLTS